MKEKKPKTKTCSIRLETEKLEEILEKDPQFTTTLKEISDLIYFGKISNNNFSVYSFEYYQKIQILETKKKLFQEKLQNENERHKRTVQEYTQKLQETTSEIKEFQTKINVIEEKTNKIRLNKEKIIKEVLLLYINSNLQVLEAQEILEENRNIYNYKGYEFLEDISKFLNKNKNQNIIITDEENNKQELFLDKNTITKIITICKDLV